MWINISQLTNRISMKKLRLLSLVIFMIIVLQSSISTSAWGTSFNVKIYQAYYGDIDNDGYEDDVFVKLKFYLNSFDDDYDEFVFRYSIILTLPSGLSFQYWVTIFGEDESIVTIENLFYNHATEYGDYVVDVFAVLYIPYFDTAEANQVFDPPGSSDGLEPEFDTIIS